MTYFAFYKVWASKKSIQRASFNGRTCFEDLQVQKKWQFCSFQKSRYSILIRSNKIQQYADIYLLQNRSTCFGWPSHPSSGVHKTVTAASGTGHSVRATTFLRRGQIWPRRRKVVAQILWPVPEVAVTVLCTPDDGCDGHPKHVEWFYKCLHIVASCWILLI